MKYLVLFAVLLFAATSCRKGKQSKKIKFHGYQLVTDGNNGDSVFFELKFQNKSAYSMKDPHVDIRIKDTSNAIFKETLFTADQDIEDVPGKSYFFVYFYAGDFQITNEIGKIKTRIDWTNSADKNSFRRWVEYH